MAHELEFYLCEPDAAAPPTATARTPAMDSPPYTVGYLADPRGTLSAMLDAAVRRSASTRVAAAHEYGRSQYEINLRHGGALDAADRAFRFKDLVKELAARDGLLRDLHGQAVQRATRARGCTCTSRSPTRRSRTPAPTPPAADGLVGARAPLPRRRDRARAGDDGVPQPDGELLPADPRRGARADADLLGPRPPHDARARAARARRRDAAGDAPRRRHGQPLPRERGGARRRPRRHQARARRRRSRSRASSTSCPRRSRARRCRRASTTRSTRSAPTR